ncbi:MAG: AtpZ/AtpI family protein [Candidatus Acidiferrales bacterium]
MSSNQPRQRPVQNSGSFARQLAAAIELPFVIVAGPLIGGGFGWLVDKKMHTSPWLMLVFGLAGFAGGVLAVLRTLGRAEKDDENSSRGE